MTPAANPVAWAWAAGIILAAGLIAMAGWVGPWFGREMAELGTAGGHSMPPSPGPLPGTRIYRRLLALAGQGCRGVRGVGSWLARTLPAASRGPGGSPGAASPRYASAQARDAAPGERPPATVKPCHIDGQGVAWYFIPPAPGEPVAPCRFDGHATAPGGILTPQLAPALAVLDAITAPIRDHLAVIEAVRAIPPGEYAERLEDTTAFQARPPLATAMNLSDETLTRIDTAALMADVEAERARRVCTEWGMPR